MGLLSHQASQLRQSLPAVYVRHRAETTLLFQVIREYWPEFQAELAGHGRQLPAYVKKEFDEYLKCGMLEHGFLLDGKEIYRNDGIANELAEPMFAILNFAKINNAAMTQNWEMEVDWVKYEAWQ